MAEDCLLPEFDKGKLSRELTPRHNESAIITDTPDKMKKRVEYAMQYINNWSCWIDLGILVKTTRALVLAETY